MTGKQGKWFAEAIKEGAQWMAKRGGKAVGTPKGRYAIKTIGGKLYKLSKKEGIVAALKKTPGIGYDVSMKTWLAKPKLNFEAAYAKYKKAYEFKHGVDPAFHPKEPHKKLKDKLEWAASKVPGKDYVGEMPHFDKMGGFLGQRASRHVWRKVTAGGALAAAGITTVGHFTDKSKLEGHVETPRGHRIEASSSFLSVNNPEGKGGQWSVGAGAKLPGGFGGSGGWRVGIGHAHKAGVAHQAGVNLNLYAPFGKTGFKAEQQHAFGVKSRSRRVAAIRRATFGGEQHLGITKKPNRAQRAKDSLY